MATVEAFVASLIFNAVIALIVLIIYSILRPKYDYVYQPNFKNLTEHLQNKISEKKLSLLKKMTLSSSFFAWLTPSFRCNDDELYELVGFDAFVYLRFIRLCFKLAAFSLPYAAVVLIPVNVVDGKDLSGMDLLTLGNIPDESHKLWAHLIGVWLFSILLYYFMYAEWRVYVKYRQIHLKEKLKHHYSVLITQLPSEVSKEEDFRKFVDELFPEQVANAYLVRDLDEWRKLVQKHNQLVLKLEHAKAVFEDKGERPEHKLKPIIGEKVDSINHFDEELRGTQTELEHEKDTAESNVTNAGIVTFKTIRDARIASNALWQAKPYNTFVTPAPEASNIIWSNLKTSVISKWIRYFIIAVLLFLLVIFWMIPVGLVSALVSLESLQEKVSFLEAVNDLPGAVKGIIEGVLSTLALVIFFAILPMLLAFMSKQEGIFTNSGVAKSVIGKMFIFTIVNKFLIMVIAGAFLNQLKGVLDDPGSLPKLLAESLPAMALFFTNFAMLQALMGHSMRLLRIGPLIVIHIKRKWLAKTPRELKNVWAPPCPNYGVMFPNDLYIFIIGVAYCIQAPIVIPFVMLYFGFGYIVHFYSMVYVNRPPFTSGGKMWPKVFNRMLVAIVVFQVLMIGVFGLKKNAAVSVLSIPPLVFTIVFKIFIGLYMQPASVDMELDCAQQDADEGEVDEEFLQCAHNDYIDDASVPGLFALSTDDQSDETKPQESELEESTRSQTPHDEETKNIESFHDTDL